MKLNAYWKKCFIDSPNVFIKNYTEYEFSCVQMCAKEFGELLLGRVRKPEIPQNILFCF